MVRRAISEGFPLRDLSLMQRRSHRVEIAEIVSRCREWAAAGGSPVVVVDLDLTAWWPYARVRAALRHLEVAEGLHGLVDGCEGGLPGLYSGAWSKFIAAHALADRWPHAPRLEAEYRSALSWTPAALKRDVLAEGLAEFAGAVRAAGGQLVALTGRPRWLENASAAQLRVAGLPSVGVVTAPRRCGRATPEGKEAARLPGIDDEDVVAAADD